MPDSDGKLTEEEKKKITDWMATRWPADHQSCPVCGDTNWFIADHIVVPLTSGPGMGVRLGGVSYPQVMLISLKCGYTRFFNAVVLGLAAPIEEKKSEEKKE